MPLEIIAKEDYLTAELSGEIDHHTALYMRTEIDRMFETSTPKMLILDFENVAFMDSSGIGLILGRKRMAESYGSRVMIKNPNKAVEKIMRLAGISNMIIP